jgi:hypothetical protein
MDNRILALARVMLTDPRGATRAILTIPVGRAQLIEAAILVAVLAVFVSRVATLVHPPSPDDPLAGLVTSPFLMGIVQFVLLIVVAIGTFLIGRAFGGTGSFHASIQAMVWLNFVVVLIELVELPLYIFGLWIVAPVNLATMVFAIWLSVNAIAELHGFQSLMKVLAGMIGSVFVVSFVILMVLGLFVPDI